MSGTGTETSERDLMFCHQCEDEWYRDDRGLQCPRCGSDIVEIIQPDTDPRNEHDLHEEHEFHDHPLHDHNPWGGDAPDPDEGNIEHAEWTGPGGARISRTTFRSTTPSGGGGGGARPAGMPPGFPDAFGPMFGGLMGNVPPNARAPQTATGGNTGNPSGPFGGGRLGATYTVSIGGPGRMRFTRTGGTGGDVGMEDLNGIMGNIFGMFGPPGGVRPRGTGPEAGGNIQGMPFNPMMRLLMDLVPPLSGSAGDVAYTQEAYDRILTMLRDQHEGSNAPGPASAAAIEALPKIKISKEHLDDTGKADCSICMESVALGTEVTELPCQHWFHEECVRSWLKEHDTCPQCRRGITPKEGDQDTPRTTGQAPRYWQVNEGDINALARGPSNESQPPPNNGESPTGNSQASPRSFSRTSTSQSPNQGTRGRDNEGGRLSGVAGFISGIGRRLGGHNDSGGSRN